ncbi:hypothetical protein Tco_1088791 [Tanacetum coccineum]
MINQLHNISSILESNTQNSSNVYSQAPPSPLIRPATHAQFPQHLKLKDADSTTIQTLQVQVTELKSENEGLKLSVEELTKARELIEVTLRQRDELVSAQCEKIRLLEEQSETFHEVKSEFDSDIYHDTQYNSGIGFDFEFANRIKRNC